MKPIGWCQELVGLSGNSRQRRLQRRAYRRDGCFVRPYKNFRLSRGLFLMWRDPI